MRGRKFLKIFLDVNRAADYAARAKGEGEMK